METFDWNADLSARKATLWFRLDWQSKMMAVLVCQTQLGDCGRCECDRGDCRKYNYGDWMSYSWDNLAGSFLRLTNEDGALAVVEVEAFGFIQEWITATVAHNKAIIMTWQALNTACTSWLFPDLCSGLSAELYPTCLNFDLRPNFLIPYFLERNLIGKHSISNDSIRRNVTFSAHFQLPRPLLLGSN